MARFPGTSRARTREGGFSVVHSKDFVAHAIDGDDWRHESSHINISPSISGLSATNVREGLVEIYNSVLSNGSGFISIGDSDGYAVGNYNVNSLSTPTLEDAFTAAFADDRLANGGIILLLAGTYNAVDTIDVPPGMTIMGEISGTIINGQTSEVPIFKILRATKTIDVNGNSGSGDQVIPTGSNFDKTKLFNLILIDNFGGSINSGNSTMTTIPMVQVERGANFEAERVTCLGRLNDGVILNRTKTLSFIGTTSGNSNGTVIDIKDCFVDGVRHIVRNDTQLGSLDFVKVSNSKFRFYGAEGGSYVSSSDCAIYSSLANISLINNYFYGKGSQAKTILTLGTTGGSSLVKIQLIGNTGKYESSNSPILIDNQTGQNSVESICTNNNWGNNDLNYIPDEWYITIASSSSNSSIGDLFGSASLQTLIDYADDNDDFDPTIYLLPGTYTITSASGTANNLKLIGLPKGSNYPIVRLNLSAGSTDALGNRYFGLGNKLENIKFQSINNFSSLLVTWNVTSSAPDLTGTYHSVNINNCIFEDITCFIASNYDGVDNWSQLSIENCKFRQTGLHSNNVSLTIPQVNIGNISHCIFTGLGYSISYGTIYSDPPSIGYGKLNLNNCYFDLIDVIIDGYAPSPANSYYLDLNDDNSEIVLNNCITRVTSSSWTATANLFSGINSTRFINISGMNIQLLNCKFNLPNDTYNSGTNAIAGIYLNWQENIVVVGNSFSGGNNLKIVKSGNNVDSVIIENNSFDNTSSANTLTLLDIEADSNLAKAPTVIIKGNDFYNSQTAGSAIVEHFDVTSTAYNTFAIVQIYVKGGNVFFEDNIVSGGLIVPTTTPTHMAGVYINSYSADSGATTRLNSIIVTNNNINIIGATFVPGSSSGYGASLFTRGSLLQISDNILNYNNTGGATSGFRGDLVLDSILISSVGDSIISNNIFNRSDGLGSLSSLDRGYVLITSSTNYRGSIIDNSFVSSTIDGSSTVVVEDNATLDWFVERNKNQTKLVKIYGTQGVFCLNHLSTTRITRGNSTAALDSYVAVNPNPQLGGTGNVTFQYSDTTDTLSGSWIVNLSGVVPHGARIVSLSVALDIDANPSTGNVTLTLNDNSPGTSADTDSVTGLTTAGDTLTVTPSDGEYVSGFNDPFAEISITVVDGSTKALEVGPLEITYRY